MSTSQSLNIIPIEYSLQTYQRSNQDTSMLHRPVVKEGEWVQAGDLLSDCASSVGGEFSIGHNILIAYLPWEGYNYEDAILISERLVYDDLYTSIHIERYDISIEKNPYGIETITKDIVLLKDTSELNHLDKNGIAKLGSWLKEGDILVGKITPTESKKEVARYVQLYNDILGKKVDYSIRDSSLRVPRGLEAKVIRVKTFPEKKTDTKNLENWEKEKKATLFFPSSNKIRLKSKTLAFSVQNFLSKNQLDKKRNFRLRSKWEKASQECEKKNKATLFFSSSLPRKNGIFENVKNLPRKSIKNKRVLGLKKKCSKNDKKSRAKALTFVRFFQLQKKFHFFFRNFLFFKAPRKQASLFFFFKSEVFEKEKNFHKISLNQSKKNWLKIIRKKEWKTVENFGKKEASFLRSGFSKTRDASNSYKSSCISSVHIYLAEKRKVQVGDKMAGRHGNKGIISQILPRQDMPYLPDGTPIDMALNPLGVPSRMNVGQIYECLLGLAGKYLGEQYRIQPFDEAFGPEASRSFVFSKLYSAKTQTGQSWLFQPTNPGKLKLFDGRTGNCFDQPITTGYSYMIKLVHLVDDKIHCLTIDHEVLTTKGWIPLNKVKTSHLVATLNKDGQLVYQNPTNIYHYPEFKGELYHIKNANLDLLVTLNHKMYVKNGIIEGNSLFGYQLIQAKDIVGQHTKYCKTAFWNKENYQFMLPSIISSSIVISDKSINMDAWLKFFGIWIAEGWALTNNISNSNVENFNQTSPYVVQISIHKKKVLEILNNVIPILGYSFSYSENHITIRDKQLWAYLRPLSLGNPYRRLPTWVWDLSQDQARVLLLAMISVFKKGENSECCKKANGKKEKPSFSLLPETQLFSPSSSFFSSLTSFFPEFEKEENNNGLNYYTSSMELAGDITRLALHAGWSGNNYLLKRKGSYSILDGKEIINQFDIWHISIIQSKNQPSVNHGSGSEEKEEVLTYQGAVYCLSVPNEIFYVRRKGLPVWTGNSRSSGPYSLITQQPLKGRSKHGGQRLGEMEVWAIEAYGAAFTLLELLTIKSDDVTGRLTIWDYVLYKKPLYIGTPASFKVLICELQALCLDIGIYKADKSNILKQINVSSMG